jgi:ATP-dependent RNA helicase DDX54/DBP10
MKLIRTESGQKLSATYKSGKYDEWASRTKIKMPKVGEAENTGSGRSFGQRTKYRHQKTTAPKQLDKFHKDYDKKVKQMKKKTNRGEEDGDDPSERYKPGRKAKTVGKPTWKAKSELKTVDQVRKQRKIVANRKAKNARPSRKVGKRR